MHIVVPVKRVVDPNIKVRVRSDGSDVDTTGAKMSMNPFDEVAVEQAVRLRASGVADKVTVVTCGPAVAQDVLRTALAMGADSAVLMETPEAPDALGLARALRAFVVSEAAGLVILGKQASDDDLGATGPMLAALLDWPQAVSVSTLVCDGVGLQVACDADAGTELLELDLPAVLGVDLRLCEPRNITLPAMMRAKKTAITTLPLAELCVINAPLVRVLSVVEPAARQPGAKLPGLDALVDVLRHHPALAALPLEA